MNNSNNIMVVWSGEIDKVSVGSNYIHSYTESIKDSCIYYFNIGTSAKIMTNYLVKLKRLYSLPISSDILLKFWRYLYIENTLKDLIKLIDDNNIKSIWFFANSLEAIIIGQKLINSIKPYNINYNVFVWDSIEYIIQSRKISKKNKTKINSYYLEILDNADNIACISKGMQENLIKMLNYTQPQQIDKFSILPFPITSFKRNIDYETNKLFINIVFVGSTYCWKEWNAFIRSLDKKKWIINNKKVFLHVFGVPNIRSQLYKYREQIKYHQPVKHDDLVTELSKYNYAYLPYFYDENKMTTVTTSLPGKLSTYVEAKLPIIFHGPVYSSAALLINEYNLGSIVTNRDSIDLEEVIKDLKRVEKSNFEKCFVDFYSIDNHLPKIKKFM